jgi:hemin uptake protein HemP
MMMTAPDNVTIRRHQGASSIMRQTRAPGRNRYRRMYIVPWRGAWLAVGVGSHSFDAAGLKVRQRLVHEQRLLFPLLKVILEGEGAVCWALVV